MTSHTFSGPITRDASGRPHCVMRDALGYTIELEIGATEIRGTLLVPGEWRVEGVDEGEGQGGRE